MDEYEAMEKMKELKVLRKKQDEVKLENSMLSEHLSRVMMRKGSMQLHLENLEAEEEEEEAERQAAAAAASASSRRKSSQKSFRIFHESPAPRTSVRFSIKTPARIAEQDRPERASLRAPMSVEEKLDIVDVEVSAHSEHMNRLRTEHERVMDDLRAVLHTTEYGMREIANERNIFSRDLLVLAELNPRKKLLGEDFLRFQDEKLRKKRNLREKLQEKLDLLHMEIMEAEHQFAGKRDLSETLHPVDFDYYKISNIKLTNRIGDRTKESWKLKGTMKITTRLLFEARNKLEKKIEERISIRHHLADRSQQIVASQELIAVEKKQHRKLTEDMIRLIQETDGPPQPHVLDYMRMRIKSAELRKEMNRWLTKVEIMEQSHAQLKRHVRSVLKQRQADAALLNPSTPETAPLVALVHG